MLEVLHAGRSVLAAGGMAATALLGFCTPPGGGPPPATPACGDAKGLEAVGLVSDGSLVCFDTERPDQERSLGQVNGLENETIVGIDHRSPFADAAGVSNGVPAEGQLYALGSNGGFYSHSVGDDGVAATKKSQLDVALQGGAFDIDFNPTVDRLRIVSDAGQNLRANVDTGVTVVDGSLNAAGAPVTGVVGAAYTNTDTDPATSTTLYDIDAALDRVLLQSPPNDGGLVAVGNLGVDATPAVGFDLYSELATTPAGTTTTVDVHGFASLQVGGVAGFYSITPFSGAASMIGAFDVDVVDISLPLYQ